MSKGPRTDTYLEVQSDQNNAVDLFDGTGNAQAKFGWWGPAAAEDILGRGETANIERATFTKYGINLGHARVLKRLAGGEHLRYTHTYARVTA